MSRAHFVATAVLASLVVLVSFARSRADVDVEGTSYRVVDMHLHPGDFGRFPAGGRTFVIESLPPFVRPYAPALGNAGIDPWAEHVGIRAQTEMAGVERAVLYAVYAPRSTGWYTNRELEAVLTDPRNRNADGSPWAYGMASLSFEGYLEEGVAERRLDALRSYFTAHPDLFVGIKLAHPHQHVALDDGRYLGVFDVAAEVGVPVLLHTGFSPFPVREPNATTTIPRASRPWSRPTTARAAQVGWTSCSATSAKATREPSPPRSISRSASTTSGSR